jgi:Tfp pilus assembly protein PilF
MTTMVLSACSSTPVVERPDNLFSDKHFMPPGEKIQASEIFTIDSELRTYLDTNLAPKMHEKGVQQALFDAMYGKQALKLEYDAVITRNASETFKARSGNCLSLVILTAAIAKEYGISLQYQKVYVDENWSRNNGLYFSSGHVNVVLGKKRFENRMMMDKMSMLTIDFLPPEDTAIQRTADIEEKTIIAMYMNNRAAESLVRGKLDDAYWWSREAIMQDPQFSASYNTLGVIYLQHHNAQQARIAFNYALERDPGSTTVMTNLLQTLNQLGEAQEAQKISAKLSAEQPYPPFHFFKLGMTAMEQKDYKFAKKMFSKELDRAPSYHEFHYWLAIAQVRLGEIQEAKEHLSLAIENSTTRKDHAIYSAKRDYLQTYAQH